MEGITPDQLINTVVVLLAVFAAIITIDKVAEIFKKWRTPSANTQQMLANDDRRLNEHDETIKNLQASNQVLCAGIMALLDHELHNGNADQMQKARDDLMEHLKNQLAR